MVSSKADIQKAIQNAPPDWSHRYEAKVLLEELSKAGF
jgi:hypothetical protein